MNNVALVKEQFQLDMYRELSQRTIDDWTNFSFNYQC